MNEALYNFAKAKRQAAEPESSAYHELTESNLAKADSQSTAMPLLTADSALRAFEAIF